MDIKLQLQSELSRANIDYTIHALGNNPEYFKELITFVLKEPDPLPMRASWAVEGITASYPDLIKPYMGNLIMNLRKFTHPGTRRNLLKIFSRMEIPAKFHGTLLDICFDWIGAEDRTVAEKVFSMQIIANHIHLYPDLINEFIEIMQDQLPKNSPAYASRYRLIRKQLKF